MGITYQGIFGISHIDAIDPYNAHFDTEECDICANNTWFMDEIS
jgi:hypothetical protein